MARVLAAEAAVLLQLDPLPRVPLVLLRDVVATLARLTRQVDRWSFVTHWLLATRYSVLSTYLVILMTRPAPTVRPPSRIANRNPSSIAIG